MIEPQRQQLLVAARVFVPKITVENIMKYLLRYCAVLALSLLSLASAGFAQSNTATLLGAVTDPTGAVIPGASVHITNAGTQVSRTTRSGSDGAYEVPLLPVGEYTIAVEAGGFKRAERSGIVLEAGNRIKIDVALQIGDLAERVRVEGDAPLVATQNADRGIVISSEEVSNLPLNGRNFAQLISLQQGVIVGSMIGNSITFNGLPYNGTTINIDGTDAANPDRPTAGNYSGQTRLALVSQEFIQEFKTSQGVFSAEIGRATGGSVNVITKSGTNELHGSLYEFVRNDRLDARNFFARAKDPLRLNQFGITASGPLIRNKLFIFGGWEASRERRGVQVTGTVPTDSFRRQLIDANPRFAEILNLMPPVTEALPGDTNRGFHRRSDSRRQREDVGQGRIDFAPRSGDNFFARYTIFDASVVQPNISPVNGFTFPSQDRSFTFSWSHALSPRMINELRFGANKQDLPRNYAAFVPGGAGTLQGYLGTPDLEFLRANGGSWTIADNFSRNNGRHSLKMGFEVRRYHNGRTNYQNPIYVFDTAADLLASRPASATLSTAFENVARIQTTGTGIFFQDDFRLRRDVTLNLGIRYEYFSPPIELNGRLYNVASSPYGPFRQKGEAVWNSDRNNFGPRAGLAWDMFGSSRNVIRMGAGVYYSDNPLRGLTLITRPPSRPASLVLSRGDSPNLRYPVDPFNIDPALLIAPVSRTIIDPHHRTTYAVLWSFDYQRQITPSTAATIGYIGNHGVKQL
ncbi:MAG TPA: TonB-dependent receptor, partial [Bryobacteraceae bacterium]|nr:TonB-dependent receptor [Bryobacteraceae bacterium]